MAPDFLAILTRLSAVNKHSFKLFVSDEDDPSVCSEGPVVSEDSVVVSDVSVVVVVLSELSVVVTVVVSVVVVAVVVVVSDSVVVVSRKGSREQEVPANKAAVIRIADAMFIGFLILSPHLICFPV